MLDQRIGAANRTFSTKCHVLRAVSAAFVWGIDSILWSENRTGLIRSFFLYLFICGPISCNVNGLSCYRSIEGWINYQASFTSVSQLIVMENDGNLDLSELLDPFLGSDLGSNTHRTIHLNFKNILLLFQTPVFSTIAFGVASVLEQITRFRSVMQPFLKEKFFLNRNEVAGSRSRRI